MKTSWLTSMDGSKGAAKMRNDSGENLWGMRIIAFAMALLLFVFVNYENSQRVQSTNPGDGASITGVEVLEDVPININVDRDQYYVSGIPESAEVRLRGPQSLILQTLATQNVTVETPDLNALGLGVHEIELYIDDLSNQIEYRIDPMTVTVTIEEKVALSYNLSVVFNEEDVAAGYTVGEPELSQTEVLVTGSATAMANIDSVQVVVPSGEGEYTDSINMSLPVVVTDQNGELLDVSVEPSEVNIFIPVEMPSKTVPLTLEEVGEANEDYTYNVSFAEGQAEEITIFGPNERLAEIEAWPIEVDLSGIEEDTQLEVPIGTYNDISEANMETVSVIIEVEGSDADATTASGDTDATDTTEEEESESKAEAEAENDTSGNNSDGNDDTDNTNNSNNNTTNPGSDTSNDTPDENAATEDVGTNVESEEMDTANETDPPNGNAENNTTE